MQTPCVPSAAKYRSVEDALSKERGIAVVNIDVYPFMIRGIVVQRPVFYGLDKRLF